VTIRTRLRLRSFILTGIALALPAAEAPAAAAEVGGGSSATSLELDTITVTAQKREEKLQEIPAAATAITMADIERAGVNNIQDVAQLTPNLVIIDQLRPGIQTVSFRGFTTVQGGQSPFAIVVDGVAEPGQEFLKQQLVDVQQIEILRGPQGTLYGAGAVAGAINIVTQQPTNEYTAAAKLGYAQGDQATGQLTVSGPIVPDKLFFRASAYSDSFEGLIDNPASTCAGMPSMGPTARSGSFWSITRISTTSARGRTRMCPESTGGTCRRTRGKWIIDSMESP
jgi:iron complex outermembrane recepter protein